MFGKIPLALVGLIVGSILTVVGFAAYATGNATLNLAGFFYGIPLLLGGLALKAAELKPVPLTAPTTAAIATLRKQKATATQLQIFNDVTRYRYGQEAHLDKALDFLGLRPSDEERPVLVGIRESQIDGSYALVLNFDSPSVPVESWLNKLEKMTTFFGPGVQVTIHDRGEDEIEVSLISLPA
ncbi:MAG: DUF2854 domain-containing protein [Synechococcales bacterium]|nr:DUF2854 domain-containing protein [Synechococcales bacterium]